MPLENYLPVISLEGTSPKYSFGDDYDEQLFEQNPLTLSLAKEFRKFCMVNSGSQDIVLYHTISMRSVGTFIWFLWKGTDRIKAALIDFADESERGMILNLLTLAGVANRVLLFDATYSLENLTPLIIVSGRGLIDLDSSPNHIFVSCNHEDIKIITEQVEVIDPSVEVIVGNSPLTSDSRGYVLLSYGGKFLNSSRIAFFEKELLTRAVSKIHKRIAPKKIIERPIVVKTTISKPPSVQRIYNNENTKTFTEGETFIPATEVPPPIVYHKDLERGAFDLVDVDSVQTMRLLYKEAKTIPVPKSLSARRGEDFIKYIEKLLSLFLIKEDVKVLCDKEHLPTWESVFTHRSIDVSPKNYELLELTGDSALDYAQAIYYSDPTVRGSITPDEVTNIRHVLLTEQIQSQIALCLKMDAWLTINSPELVTSKVLGDVTEAFAGALSSISELSYGKTSISTSKMLRNLYEFLYGRVEISTEMKFGSVKTLLQQAGKSLGWDQHSINDKSADAQAEYRGKSLIKLNWNARAREALTRGFKDPDGTIRKFNFDDPSLPMYKGVRYLAIVIHSNRDVAATAAYREVLKNMAKQGFGYEWFSVQKDIRQKKDLDDTKIAGVMNKLRTLNSSFDNFTFKHFTGKSGRKVKLYSVDLVGIRKAYGGETIEEEISVGNGNSLLEAKEDAIDKFLNS